VSARQPEGDTISRKSGFIDIHSHILPGLDDGPVHLDQSIEEAKRYMALGFVSVIATPHWIHATQWASTPESISSKVIEINSVLQQNKIELTILPGMEIAYSENLHEHVASGQCLSLGGKGFYLIEFPLLSTLTRLPENTLKKLLSKCRNKCIIAHPERCPVFDNDKDMLARLVNLGMLVQVNMGSLLGQYGRKAQKTAFHYFRSGLVHFLATDSHARANRKPPDQMQWKNLVNAIGEDAVATAFAHNPKQMLAGNDVIPLSSKSNTTMPSFSGPGKCFLKSLQQRIMGYVNR